MGGAGEERVWLRWEGVCTDSFFCTPCFILSNSMLLYNVCIIIGRGLLSLGHYLVFIIERESPLY